MLSYPNLFPEVQICLSMSLSVLDFLFQRRYVRLSTLPIWFTRLCILPSLNCLNYIKWATWISKFLKCNILSSIYILPILETKQCYLLLIINKNPINFQVTASVTLKYGMLCILTMGKDTEVRGNLIYMQEVWQPYFM